MVGHGGSSAGSYLADPISPISSHRTSIVVTSPLRVNNHFGYVNPLSFTFIHLIGADHFRAPDQWLHGGLRRL